MSPCAGAQNEHGQPESSLCDGGNREHGRTIANMAFNILGINHKTAPVALREKVAFTDFLAQCPQGGNQPILAELHLFAQRDGDRLMVDTEDIKCHVRYSAAVFSISTIAKTAFGLTVLVLSACAGTHSKAGAQAPQSFYTVTGEIALVRQQPRVAALQYATAAAHESDPALLQRATDVTAETLQPSLMAGVAARWLVVDPKSLQAQRAAARAALALYKVDEAAAHYRIVFLNSPAGVDADFADVETDLGSNENVFGAHQLADRLASYFPRSPSALRIQGIAAMRADDPAAAVHSLSGALA